MKFFRIVEHIVNGAHTREYATATVNGDADAGKIKLAVKQYIPLDNPNPQLGDVTIIGAHANGFPKELYEPLWDDLHQRLANSGVRIRSIWIADMWNQGQSGVLNEKLLGNDPSWWDNTRDILALITQKSDQMPHPLVGVGHSMGGAQLTLLALSNPRLFHSLILIDPIMQPLWSNSGIMPAIASTMRRDLWESRESAKAKFLQSKFYQAWDPRVFDLWVKYGLREIPTELYPAGSAPAGSVTLTTTKHQELFVFLRPTFRKTNGKIIDRDPETDKAPPKGYPFYRPEPVYAFKKLPEVRPSVLYIFGGKSDASTPDQRKLKLERTGSGLGGSGGAKEGRVKEVVLDCGHLVAMEKVGETADAISGWLKQEIQRWRNEQDDLQQRWVKVDRREKMIIDEEWKREVTPEVLRKKNPKL